MKIYSSIKKICKNCKIVRRNRKLYILCDIFLKHKQRQK